MFILNTNFPSSKLFLLYIEIQDPVIDMLVEISNIYSCISIAIKLIKSKYFDYSNIFFKLYLIDILQYSMSFCNVELSI